jgi:hypothetical protein
MIAQTLNQQTTREQIVVELDNRLTRLRSERAKALDLNMVETVRALQQVIISVEEEINLYEY